MFNFLGVRSLSRVQLLGPRGPQHARLPCASVPPRACSDSCPWRQCCHPAISASGAPFPSRARVLSVVNSAAVNTGGWGRISLTTEFCVTTSLPTHSFNCIIYGSILMAAFSPPYGSIFLFLACLILSDGKSDHVKFTVWCWIFLHPATILGICSGCS